MQSMKQNTKIKKWEIIVKWKQQENNLNHLTNKLFERKCRVNYL